MQSPFVHPHLEAYAKAAFAQFVDFAWVQLRQRPSNLRVGWMATIEMYGDGGGLGFTKLLLLAPKVEFRGQEIFPPRSARCDVK